MAFTPEQEEAFWKSLLELTPAERAHRIRALEELMRWAEANGATLEVGLGPFRRAFEDKVAERGAPKMEKSDGT